MDATLPMCFLRVLAVLRARSVVDAVALASIPVATLLIGATVALS